MSTFTQNIKMEAVQARPIGWRRWLPPGFTRPKWRVAERFEYAVDDLDLTITVPEGFVFDGASVPMIFWPLFPMAHPQYIQASAMHDFLYSRGGRFDGHLPWIDQTDFPLSRSEVDRIFCEALGVLGMAAHWRWAFWAAVRIGGAVWWPVKRKRGQVDVS